MRGGLQGYSFTTVLGIYFRLGFRAIRYGNVRAAVVSCYLKRIKVQMWASLPNSVCCWIRLLVYIVNEHHLGASEVCRLNSCS